MNSCNMYTLLLYQVLSIEDMVNCLKKRNFYYNPHKYVEHTES